VRDDKIDQSEVKDHITDQSSSKIKETFLEIIHAGNSKANVGFSLADETAAREWRPLGATTNEWPFHVLRIGSLNDRVKISKKCPIMLKVAAQGSVIIREFQ
jgi:hypothetical protein